MKNKQITCQSFFLSSCYSARFADSFRELLSEEGFGVSYTSISDNFHFVNMIIDLIKNHKPINLLGQVEFASSVYLDLPFEMLLELQHHFEQCPDTSLENIRNLSTNSQAKTFALFVNDIEEKFKLSIDGIRLKVKAIFCHPICITQNSGHIYYDDENIPTYTSLCLENEEDIYHEVVIKTKF